jgi:hypothetical protein
MTRLASQAILVVSSDPGSGLRMNM